MGLRYQCDFVAIIQLMKILCYKAKHENTPQLILPKRNHLSDDRILADSLLYNIHGCSVYFCVILQCHPFLGETCRFRKGGMRPPGG